MRKIELFEEILSSRETSMEDGCLFIERNKTEKEVLEDILHKNDKLISIFKETMDQISIFFNDFNYAFFLLNTKYILLQIVSDVETKNKLNKLNICTGIQCREWIAGLNTFFIPKKWNKSVLFPPGYHDLEGHKYYSYLVPIEKNNLPIGYIFAIASEKEALDRVLKFMDFAVLQIICRYCKCKGIEEKVLNGKQEKILVYLAKGFTDKAIAIEMNMNYATYKYHKKNLFKILDAGCGAEAVIKGLKYGLITLEQFE